MKQVPAVADELLESWLKALHASDEEAADSALTRLIKGQIEPVIRSVIRFKLRLDPADRSYEADLVQEALAQWLGELRKFREAPETFVITDARGLAATITYRVCYGWLRRRSPHRHALKNRIQYILTRQRGLGLWPVETDGEKVLAAGFTSWNDRAPVSSARPDHILDDDAFVTRAATLTRTWHDTKLSGLLVLIFDYVGGPVSLNQLVSIVARLLQIRDDPVVSTDDNQKTIEAQLVSPENLALQVETRIFLGRLWDEVRDLPRSQRVALLLNLRESDGHSGLLLLPVTGIATVRQIAHVLEIGVEELSALWVRLPLDDLAIAGLLDLTRQQIINLRKSARERLSRRLKGFF